MAVWKEILLVIALVGISHAQTDCPEPQVTDIETVIADIIVAGDASAPPDITLLNSNVVCRAFGEQQGLLRGVSVVVEYNCTGHSDCQTDTVVEQIESGCLNGNWTNNVGGTTATDFIRSPLNGASLSTTAREDCSRCFSEQLANDVGTSTDPVTHCVECNSECDEGLMSCYGPGAGDCCNFYHNLMCVDVCPSPFMSNSDSFCVCPEGKTGNNCEITIICNELMSPAKGTVEYSDPSRIFNSTATYSCDEGYTLTGNSQRICVGLNIWSGSDPTCTVVDCGALQAPANGAVMTNPGTTVGSTAAYTCDSGYLLEGEANRTCLATGSWSNTAPTCEKTACQLSSCESCASDITKCDKCTGNKVYDEKSDKCTDALVECEQCEDCDGYLAGVIALAILLAIALVAIAVMGIIIVYLLFKKNGKTVPESQEMS